MADAWAIVSAVSAAVSAVVVIAAATYAYMQVKELKVSRGVQTLMTVHNDYQSDRLNAVRRRLQAGELADPDTLSEGDANDLANLLNQLQLIGILVDRDLLSLDLVAALFPAIPRTWAAFGPYVEHRRKSRAHYARYAERLASRIENAH